MMECLGSECGEIRGQNVEYYEKKKKKKKRLAARLLHLAPSYEWKNMLW